MIIRPRLRRLVSGALVLASLTATAAAAQDAAPRTPPPSRIVAAARVAGDVSPPTLDGRLDDAAWRLAAPATDFLQMDPAPGQPGTERTEARVVISGDALYIGMRLFDSRADSIRSQFLRRDDGGPSADWAAVILDSYHDRRTAYRFAATPRGTRTDVLHLNDTGVDTTWDAVWDVATSVDSAGWTAEFRIPLSQVRFTTSGDMVWGINFARTIGRRAEVSHWARVLPTDGRFVSLMGELRGLAGTRAGRPLEFLPYTVGRVTSDPSAASNPLKGRNVTWGSAGLDMKYGLSSNVTLTATVNPDFGQVDADPSVVNLTAFETFYPERRPFFTEGAQIFNFPLVPEGFAFYSRRIGRSPQIAAKGSAGGFVDSPGTATILGAAKLTGKLANGTSFGLIAALTDDAEARTIDAGGVRATSPVEPATRYLVARMSKDFRRGRSGVGVLGTGTTRDVGDPAFNALRSSALGAGFNGFHRFGRDRFELTGWGFFSAVNGSRAAIAATQRSSVHYWQRPDADGYDFDTTLTSMAGGAGEVFVGRIGGSRLTWQVGGGLRTSGFEVNDVGFVSYTDIWYTSAQARYRVTRPGEFVRDWWLDLSNVVAHTMAGQFVRPSAMLQGNLLFRNFWSLNASVERWNAQLWPWELRGGPGLRRSGYTNLNGTLTTDSRRSWRVRAHARLQRNDELGSSAWTVDPSFTFRPTSRTNVTLTPLWTRNQPSVQYVASATATGGVREYVVGALDQATASLTARMSYAVSPTVTLDVYAQPFVSGGSYDRFRRVVAPHARDVDQRTPLLAPGAITYSGSTSRYSVDTDGNGVANFSFANPNFSTRALRTNTVLRWEFRPGSTVYVVWAEARDDSAVSPFGLGDDASALFRAPAKDVLMIKVAYWFDR